MNDLKATLASPVSGAQSAQDRSGVRQGVIDDSPTTACATTFWVDIEDAGLRFPCRADQTVLAAMERLGRRGIPVGCRGGGCGVCKVHVLDGTYLAQKMSHSVINSEAQAAGVVLACRARPTSDLSLSVVGPMARQLHRACVPVVDAFAPSIL